MESLCIVHGQTHCVFIFAILCHIFTSSEIFLYSVGLFSKVFFFQLQQLDLGQRSHWGFYMSYNSYEVK